MQIGQRGDAQESFEVKVIADSELGSEQEVWPLYQDAPAGRT